MCFVLFGKEFILKKRTYAVQTESEWRRWVSEIGIICRLLAMCSIKNQCYLFFNVFKNCFYKFRRLSFISNSEDQESLYHIIRPHRELLLNNVYFLQSAQKLILASQKQFPN